MVARGRKATTTKDGKKRGPNNVVMVCCMSGQPRRRAGSTPYKSKKCGSPFEIEAALEKDGAWHIRYINLYITIHEPMTANYLNRRVLLSICVVGACGVGSRRKACWWV